MYRMRKFMVYTIDNHLYDMPLWESHYPVLC